MSVSCTGRRLWEHQQVWRVQQAPLPGPMLRADLAWFGVVGGYERCAAMVLRLVHLPLSVRRPTWAVAISEASVVPFQHSQTDCTPTLASRVGVSGHSSHNAAAHSIGRRLETAYFRCTGAAYHDGGACRRLHLMAGQRRCRAHLVPGTAGRQTAGSVSVRKYNMMSLGSSPAL